MGVPVKISCFWVYKAHELALFIHSKEHMENLDASISEEKPPGYILGSVS
jgi:hypothetical protein